MLMNVLAAGAFALIVSGVALFRKPVWADVPRKMWTIVCIVGVVVGVVVGAFAHNVYTAAAFGVLGSASTVTVFTDFLFMKIPKTVQRVGSVAGACLLILRFIDQGMNDATLDAILGAVIGVGLSLFFFLVALLVPKFRNLSGGGDIRMMMLLGFTMPVDPIIYAFVGSVAISVVWVVATRKRKLPYGPALSGAAVVSALVCGILGVA